MCQRICISITIIMAWIMLKIMRHPQHGHIKAICSVLGMQRNHSHLVSERGRMSNHHTFASLFLA